MPHLEKPPGLPTQPKVTDIQKMRGLGPLLSKLPTELRFQILGDCISSGRPEFMRASPALQHDGQAIIFQNATYRMRYGAPDDDVGQYPSHEACQQIQDFDITVDTRFCDPLHEVIDDLKFITWSRTPGGRCEILFIAGCALLVASNPLTIDVLNCFRHFDMLTFRVEIDEEAADPSLPCHCSTWQKEAKVVWIWGFVGKILGKAEIVMDEDGYSLIYRPRKYIEASEG